MTKAVSDGEGMRSQEATQATGEVRSPKAILETREEEAGGEEEDKNNNEESEGEGEGMVNRTHSHFLSRSCIRTSEYPKYPLSSHFFIKTTAEYPSLPAFSFFFFFYFFSERRTTRFCTPMRAH